MRGSCFPAQIFKEICSQQRSPALSSSLLLFACLLAIMITDIFEKWQPSFQLQRREIVTITAATTAVIAAKTLYSLAQQVHGKRVRFALSVIWRGKKFYGSGDCAVVPYTLPFVGSTREYRRDPQGFVEKWTKKFGPVYKMHIFGRVRVTNRQRHVLDMKIHYFWGSDNDGRFGKPCPRDLLEQWLWFPARHASCKVFRQNGCMADCLTDYNHHLHRNSTFVCWWISTNTLKLLEHVKFCWTIYIETWRITSLVSLNMCAWGNVISVYHSN